MSNSNNELKKQSFNDLMEEFESIVEWFESEEVDLDNAVEKFERGMKLAKVLKERLQEVENTVEEIKVQYDSLDNSK